MRPPLGWRLYLLGIALLGGLIAPKAIAQTSASFKLSESTVNNGGNPSQGAKLLSPHFQIAFDAIGEAAVRGALGSSSFHVDAGFVGRYPPPSEVKDLFFSNKTMLQWSPERSVGTYELYRGPISSLPGNFGSCLASDLATELATDASTPAAGQGFFYLATARNRLREEGPKGYRANGVEESNPAPCP